MTKSEVSICKNAEIQEIEQDSNKFKRFLLENNTLIFILFFALFLYFYLNLFRGSLIDDSFINLNYVRNIIQDGTWGFYPGHIANTATSPLNVVLLTLFSLVFGVTTETPILLTLCFFVLMAFTLDQISLQLFNKRIFGRIAAFAFVFNPLMISTIGLESIIVSTLLIISIYCFITQKWYLLAFILGMLSITRADGFLYAIVFIIFLPTPKMRFRVLGIFVLSIAPWYFFSWIYLGSLIPDTFFIKSVQSSWEKWDFINGVLLYLQRYPEETILSFSLFPLFGLLLFKQVRKSSILMLLLSLGSAHFLGYSLLGVPPFHWYYSPEITVVILFGSLGVGIVYKTIPPNTWQKLITKGLIVICFFIPIIGMFHILARDHFNIREMPIHTNTATQIQYKEIGNWLKDNYQGKSILLRGEIGTLSYYCNCYLVDWYSDRTWLIEAIDNELNGKGLRAEFYKTNFYFLHEPPDFPASSIILITYTLKEKFTDLLVKKWETSTKWTSQNEITLLNISLE